MPDIGFLVWFVFPMHMHMLMPMLMPILVLMLRPFIFSWTMDKQLTFSSFMISKSI